MSKLYLKYREVENHCLNIGKEIEASDWKPDYIVGLTRGGLLPAALLSQLLGARMNSLDVSLRDHTDGMGPESNCWMAEDALYGKNILIVDDINDTGETLSWIAADWKTLCLPSDPRWENVFGNNVRVAAIVNNVTSDFESVSYWGQEINRTEDNTWVVFPWEEWWEI